MQDFALLEWVHRHPYQASASGATLCLVLGLLFKIGASEGRGGPSWTTALSLQIVGWLGISAVVALRLITMNKWGDLLAVIPAALIVRQAIYLRLVRRRGFGMGPASEEGAIESEGFEKKKFARIFAQARAAHDREFRVDVLAVRYGVPAALVAIVGIAQFELLTTNGAPWDVTDGAVTRIGARFASGGAFTYVLLYLGQRSIRRDLTSGAAVWSLVTMTIGPILGAVIALIWKPSGPSSSDWSYDAIFFVAGLAPRYAASAVEEVVRRLWLTKSGPQVSASQVLPMTRIRGISPEIEDRLGEEGIVDAYGLAMADPLKLYRNTAFDRRQILSWIDEALLPVFFPDDWEDVRKADVSGVIDLATRLARARRMAPAVKGAFDVLEKRIAKPTLSKELLRDVAELIYEDAQVELIWALYQATGDGTEEVDEAPAPASHAGTFKGQAPSPQSLWATLAPWLAVVGLGAVLALAAWNLTWEPSSTFLLNALASMLVGAGAFVLFGSVPLHDDQRVRFLEIAAALVFLGAAVTLFVEAWTTPAHWRIGAIFLAVSGGILGAGIARAVLGVLTATKVVVTFELAGQPVAVQVTIDGDEHMARAGRLEVPLRRGWHELRAQGAAFRDVFRTFEVARGRAREIPIELVAGSPAGVIPIIKTAAGVLPTLRLESIDQQMTLVAAPPTGTFTALESGAWILSVTAPGHHPRTRVFDLARGERLELRMKLKPSKVAVAVQVPPGATLVDLVVEGVEEPFTNGGNQAAVDVRTGRRNIFARWLPAGASQPVEGARKVTVVPGGTIVVFS